MKLITGLAMVVLGILAMGEREARAQCTAPQIAAIANYYWTVKPLCQSQPEVKCAEVAPGDPKSPCRANATCMKYILLCSSHSAQSEQSLPASEELVPASFPSDEPSSALTPPPLPSRT